MVKILITGGAGFIGSALTNVLLQSPDNHVVIIDNFSRSRHKDIVQWINKPNFRLVSEDILDYLNLEKIVYDCDLVFHLAANPDVRAGYQDSNLDYEQNVLGTYYLLEAIRKSKQCRKLVFTSSSTVYGEPSVIPTPETYGPLMPISLYGASKLACEALISGYSHMFGISSIVVRLANIIGSSSTHGVIYDFMLKLIANGKSLEILGDGSQNKSYLYIDDCISALILLSKLNKKFDVYNVGSDDSIKVIDIAHIVIKALSLPNVKIQFMNRLEGRGWPGDVKEMLLACQKIRKEGWSPKYNSKEAVLLTAEGLWGKLKGATR